MAAIPDNNDFLPLPDYDLSPQRVKVTITGKILDLEFIR
jgi:hypothetical protein